VPSGIAAIIELIVIGTQKRNDSIVCNRLSAAHAADIEPGGAMSDSEPKILCPRWRSHHNGVAERTATARSKAAATFFSRGELNKILGLYGRKVATGEWCDYAIDAVGEKAVFSIFRRASEFPLYRIEKHARHRRRHGGYAVVAPGGAILKRDRRLEAVLRALESQLRPRHLRLVASGA